MTNEEILHHVDHTLLKATATWKEIQRIAEEGFENKCASICIPPSYVKPVYRMYTDSLPVCTVIGFPLGYSATVAKAREAEEALSSGALELDMVINIGDVKHKEFSKVEKEIEELKRIAGPNILKVIVETCYLEQEEKITLCKIVSNAGADYIKTSTGFGSAGADIEDILLFKEHIGPNVKIKAAGGIKTKEDMEAFLNFGCDRLGTSSALAILTGKAGNGY
jgi:deoxyribose-phosphate aldolase